MSSVKCRLITAVASALALVACSEAPTAPFSLPAQVSPVKVWARSSVGWNRRGIALFRAFGNNPGRVMAYLSLAQYRAARAAADAKEGSDHPSPAGAVAGASIVVLKQFYSAPGAISAIDAELRSQRDAQPWPGESQQGFAAGIALGREIGTAVLSLIASDRFGRGDPGLPPVGPGYWSSETPPFLGGFGAQPLVLTANDLAALIAPQPPAFGSAEFLAALAEVHAVSAGRTEDQLAIAQKWVPSSGVLFNEIAADLVVQYQRTELEAARIFAYGNAAAFDASIACFTTKFTYWFILPSVADPSITTPLGLPNYPSYPSAHNCESGAWETVLIDAFPDERDGLTAVAAEASVSRLYAGLHYSFDNAAGLQLGRAAAKVALGSKRLD